MTWTVNRLITGYIERESMSILPITKSMWVNSNETFPVSGLIQAELLKKKKPNSPVGLGIRSLEMGDARV